MNKKGIPGQPTAASLPRRREKQLVSLAIEFGDDVPATVCALYDDGEDLLHDFTGPRALEAAAAYVMQLCLDEQNRSADKESVGE